MSRAKLLLLVLIAALLVPMARRAVERALLVVSTLDTREDPQFGRSARRLAYVVPEEGWCSFELPASCEEVKVVTNASVVVAEETARGEAVRYAIRYRLAGEEGDGGRDRVYWLRSRVSREVVTLSGEVSSRLSFNRGGEEPADGRVILIAGADLPRGPRRIELRVESIERPIGGVLARVYARQPLSAAEQSFRWSRWGPLKRLRVTRGNVYPPDLLSQKEKARYCRWEWEAIAPRGVVGKDFDLRVIYRRVEVEEEERLEGAPGGVVAGPDTRATVPLPPGLHRVRVRLEREAAGRSDRELRASLEWHGDEPGRFHETSLRGREESIECTRWYEGGLLEVVASERIGARAWLEEEGGSVEITPEPRQVRAWRLGERDAVELAVHHVDDRTSTPLRLDVRALGAAGPWPRAGWEGRLAYELLGERGEVLQAGEIEALLPPSRYEVISGREDVERVSDPLRRYFRLGPSVRRLRLRGEEGELLVAGFVALPGAARRARVPEDDDAYERDRHPDSSWSLLWPLGHLALRSAGRSRVVRLQHRPLERDPLLAGGDYRWESLRPLGSWEGRGLLVRREAGSAREDDILPLLYRELPAGREALVDVGSSRGESRVDLRVVWIGGGERPGRFRLLIDNLPRLEVKAVRRGGEAVVPGVPLGQHVARVVAGAGTRVFVSHLRGAEGDVYLRKTAARLGPAPVRLVHVKPGREGEVIVARIHAGNRVEGRFGLCVEIRGPAREGTGPFEEWTFLRRHYDILPGAEQGAVTVGGSPRSVGAARKVRIALGSDLPAGEYEIETWIAGLDEAWATFGVARARREGAVDLSSPVAAAETAGPRFDGAGAGAEGTEP